MTGGEGTRRPESAYLVGTGVAVLDIPAGVPMAGYARRERPSTGTLGPLQARAIAFGDATGTRALLIVLDLLYVTAAITDRIERLVTERTGVATSAIIVSATHTHSGPSIGDPGQPLGPRVVQAACAAAADAVAGLTPASLWTDAVQVDGAGMNRRDGSSPRLDATLLVASRPDDPTAVIAVVLEYGCHATVLEHDNLLFSADYPGYARDLLEQLVGGTTIFLQGAAADINPLFHAHTPEGARALGALLAGTAGARIVRGLRDRAEPHYVNLSWNGSFPLPEPHGLRPVRPGRIRVTEASVLAHTAAPVDPVAARPALDAARNRWRDATGTEVEHRLGAELGQAWAEELRSRRVLTSGMLDPVIEGEVADVRLTARAVHLGDSCVICALPGEIFHSTAAGLRSQAGASAVLLAGYARQSVGYLPPAEAYAESGYEVGAARLGIGTAESLAEAAAGLLPPRGALG